MWSCEQTKAAINFGTIVDLAFPNITPSANEQEIQQIGDDFVSEIVSLSPAAVLCQGEFTLSYYVTHALKKIGITTLCACSERIVVDRCEEEGLLVKTSCFQFVKFREYSNP